MTAPQPIRLNTMRTPQHSAAKDALNLTSRHACGTLLENFASMRNKITLCSSYLAIGKLISHFAEGRI
jgi:hypothetical protein